MTTNKKKSILMLTVMLIAIFASSYSSATSPTRNYVSPEARFLDADIVFKGTVIRNAISDDGHQTVFFKVSELYKSPDDRYKKKVEIGLHTYRDDPFYVNGKEYIIHGKIYKRQDRSSFISIMRHLTKFSPQQYIQDLKEKGEDFSFIGTAQKIEHTSDGSPRDKLNINSTIEFKVDEIISHGNLKIDIDPSDIKQIKVKNIKGCGQAYRVGDKYILAQSSDKIKKGFKLDKKAGYLEFNGRYCLDEGPNNFKESQRLRSLEFHNMPGEEQLKIYR